MSIRPFRYPHDISAVLDITVNAFQYHDPSKQAWSVPIDLEDALLVQLQAVRRLYPVLWMGRLISPSVPSILRGFIYEERGEAIGAAMTARLHKSPSFEIGNVGVKPEYRRRGIARALMEACLQDVQDWDAEFVYLSVIDGNDPAIRLYERLGFAHYSGTTELACHPTNVQGSSPAEKLPRGYRFRKLPFAKWRPRFELAESITPQAIRDFSPICPEQFEWLPILRWLGPLFYRWSKARFIGVAVETTDGEVVGTADLTVQIENNAANTLRVSVDPAHSAVAAALLGRCIDIIQYYSPQHIILLTIEHWQEWVVMTATECGFSIDYHQLQMGMRLP